MTIFDRNIWAWCTWTRWTWSIGHGGHGHDAGDDDDDTGDDGDAQARSGGGPGSPICDDGHSLVRSSDDHDDENVMIVMKS